MTRPNTQPRFWMVWCPRGDAPRVRHHSPQDAEREAQRLAAKYPGQEFFVLRATAGFVSPPPIAIPIPLRRPRAEDVTEIPF